MQSFTEKSSKAEISPEKTKLLYAWVDRSEVVYLQAILDAYDGLARIRTERHDKNRSLLMFMVSESRQEELHDFLRHIQKEISGSIESI
ncbi:MAG: DUF4911 domain-containing protein [Deltaproteobacteria bacterium]|nr:DUF4911 domain-containing protein [Deltaproteobacteria bacterium]